jgi:hypothetical protein
MTEDHEGSSSLPIACTLTPGEFATMRDGLLPGLLRKARDGDPIPGGFRWRFNPEVGLLNEAAAVIDAEHRCCRFLRFILCIEAGEGPVWLEVTGPAGTEEFLTTLLDTPGVSNGD